MNDEFAELKDPKNANRIAQWERWGVDAIKADLQSGGLRFVGASIFAEA